MSMKEKTVADRQYEPVGKIVVRHIGDDALLVPVSGNAADDHAVFPLNETGMFIWERIVEGKSIAEISQFIAGMYRIDSDRAADDCSQFVDQLLDAGLLKAHIS